MYGHFRDMRYRNLSDVSSLREGLNVQNAAKPEARHGASLQVQSHGTEVLPSRGTTSQGGDVSGLWGMQRSDWPDTSIGHVAKYVTKNYRAPPPCAMATPLLCPYFDSTRQNRERLVITALISPTPTKRLALSRSIGPRSMHDGRRLRSRRLT